MRKIKILLIALILVLGGVFFSNAYAAKGDTRSLGASLTRPFENIKYQYLVPGDTTDLLYTIVKIYDNSDKDAEDNLAFTKALYCLRGGIGFGAEDVTTDPVTYTEIGEMHTDASDIITNYMNKYKTGTNGEEIDLNTVKEFTISKTENGTAAEETKTVNLYNAILWIIDESYLPVDKTTVNGEETVVIYDASEYKAELLDKAGVPTSQQANITDNDIEVIQQLAMWYFTNYDEQLAGTKPTVSQSTMFPSQFLSMDGDNNIDDQRANNLDRIYQYFIYGAIENADTYAIDETTGAITKTIEQNKFDKTNALQITSHDIEGIYDYYEVGPVKFESNANARNLAVSTSDIVLYDAKGNVISKEFEIYEQEETPDGEGEIISTGKHVVYKFLDSNGNEVTDLIKGQEYKIRIYKAFEIGETVLPDDLYERYDMSKFTVKVVSTYSLSNATFLSAGNASQPVVEIDKEKLSSSDEITTEYYDLALRKFITSIIRNGQNIQVADRTPSIDLSKLNTIDTRTNKKITTATYTHPKNALLVETGDKVIYKIRIYNEGELDGKALEITDYLPTGLQLVPASESEMNTTYGWVAEEGNKITTDYLKDTTIKAYDSTKTALSEGETGWQKSSTTESGLYYADVQVECEVVAQVTDANQELRNIAEISNDDGDDRDSTPNNVDINSYTPPVDNSEYQQDDDDYEDLLLEADSFDLSLRKYIVSIDGNNLEGEASRIPDININPLTMGETTADYNHKKYPLQVEIGNVITYRFTVYNEGDIDGYVYSIIDYLPEGLTFDAESNTNFIEYKQEYTQEELAGKEYAYKIEGNKITILPLNSNNLFELVAFNGETLDSKSIDVKFKVTVSESNDDQILTNAATMTYGAKGTNIADRDSNKTGEEFTVPTAEELLANLTGYKGNTLNKDELEDSNYHYEGQQDDDDFEKIIIKGKPFDLSLRKFITSIKRNGEEVDFEDRTPSINTETLINGTFNRNGVLEYTATYEHSKEPLVVKQGDIITYTLRIYNEGERAGYATEITDYIPEGLALILNYNTNFDNGWKLSADLDSSKIMKLVGEDGFYKTEEDIKNLTLEDFSDTISLSDVQLITGEVSITTNELDDQLLKAFDKNKVESEDGWQKATTGEGGLYYKDVQVSCLVIAEDTYKDTITNIAEISQDKDENENDVIDRDSTPNNKKDPYTESQEDDDDYEPVVLRYFDLALRKFITGVETSGEMTEVTSRIPNLSINEETGNIEYTHPKEESPVSVSNNDIVIYTLRVYNEGTLAGYAEEITDDIPEGLIFLPEHDVNKEYEWKMFDKDGNTTDNLEDAYTIKTEYLSQENEISENRDNLIEAFDNSKEVSGENPDYRDVKVAFRVIEPNTSNRIIVNSAQISEDSNDDEDSIPGEWNDGEDDQDKEYIYVKYFDLSLLKWVTKSIVTVDGKTITTETGFKPNTGLTETTGIRDNDENEPVAKVELDKNKLSKTTVKFAYKIRVTNEGEIAGYATEITDFIPEGLEFKAEDNKKYGWVKEGDDKVTTRALETVLLEPGESAELEIVFTWKKDKNNLGVKTNIAEITEDYNEHNSQDIDSTPENKQDPYEKEQEDDDDFALVVLSLKTGKGASYIILITAVIAMLAGGIYLIKRYVLTY